MPDHPPPFATLAAGSGSEPADLLLALAGELELHDRARAVERLDDLGRTLFGVAAQDLEQQVTRLSAAITADAGFRAGGEAAEHLLLPRVLAGGRGHPVVLASAAAEIGRRAGMSTAVLSGPTGWYVGVWVQGDSTLALVRLSPGTEPSPPQVRAHCGHEVAYAVLDGLERRFAERADPRAERARDLRRALPLTRSVAEAVGRAELRARTW